MVISRQWPWPRFFQPAPSLSLSLSFSLDRFSAWKTGFAEKERKTRDGGKGQREGEVEKTERYSTFVTAHDVFVRRQLPVCKV